MYQKCPFIDLAVFVFPSMGHLFTSCAFYAACIIAHGSFVLPFSLWFVYFHLQIENADLAEQAYEEDFEVKEKQKYLILFSSIFYFVNILIF